MIEFSEEEIKEDRQRSLDQLEKQFDSTIAELRERYEHPIAYSEVMHPAFILMETVDSYLSESPSILFDEEAYRHAHNASTALFNLYQRLGSLRYEKEITVSHPNFNFAGASGAWVEIFFMLGAAPISYAIKSGIALSLSVYATDSDDDAATAMHIVIDPPQTKSFRDLLQFLSCFPELPQPSLNLNDRGLFTLCYYKEAGGATRFQVTFDGGTNAMVTHTLGFHVETKEQRIDQIKLPDWLRQASLPTQ
jgi:hypothetical protein